ncbi:MAG: hypothetical protein ACXWF0_13810 [Usitatibacter sp.]
MTGWLRRNPAIAALGVLAVALLVTIGLEARYGASPASVGAGGARRPAAPPESKLLPPIALAAPEQAYPETAARPLFTPTRRPAPEAPAAAQSTFQKGQFVLLGVIAVGSNRTAMLREKASGRVVRVEVGREVNGIKVVEIEPETVTLAQGGEQEKLALSVQKGPGAAVGAPSQGPFAAPAAPPAAPPPAQAPGAPPAQPAQFPRPAPAPGVPPQNISQGGALGGNPVARATSDSATPLTPEELLARRRARRTQHTQ